MLPDGFVCPFQKRGIARSFIKKGETIVRSVLTTSVGFFICLSMCPVPSVDAETKKLDDKSLSMAKRLAKDREAAFFGEKAMQLNEFQESWKLLATRLNELYAGHKVRVNKVGAHVRFRMGFSHLTYMGLKVHTRVTPLNPSPGDLVAGYPFLQELVLDGSFYPHGSQFPVKMKDLLQVEPQIVSALRESLDGWEKKYRQRFEKEFPIKAAKTME